MSLTFDLIVFQFHRLPTVRLFTALSCALGYRPSSETYIRWTLQNLLWLAHDITTLSHPPQSVLPPQASAHGRRAL
ncbi:hypothetical protein N7536_007684 [Penicillium majusculum]|nr:hypothetical protein N7536_007684 [Penicillium majusculum]